VVSLLEQLIGKGRNVRVYDPHISLDTIYGSNRDFILTAIPHIGRLLESKAESVLEWADHVVLAQSPSPVLAQAIQASGRPILDLVGSGLFAQ
jgi:GDP-mannose 6-dehydrogenase